LFPLFYIILLTFALLYVILICAAIIYWNRHNDLSAVLSDHTSPPLYLSVLIPFRNEVAHLPALLKSLELQSMDSDFWECIFIDDHSTDQGAELIRRISKKNFRIVLNPGKGKKSAIAAAVNISGGNYIVQTDADCTMGKDWLKSIYTRLVQSDIQVLAGPVHISNSTSFLGYFQTFDFIAFMGMTHLGIQSRLWHLANGANLIYNKSVYTLMNTTNRQAATASGDDMFLIETAAGTNKEKIGFLKEPKALVQTQAVSDLRTFIHQRLRWGSKMGKLRDWKIKLVLGITLMFSILLVVVSIAAMFVNGWWAIAGLLWTLKGSIDFIYLKNLAPFFNQKIPFFPYLRCTIIYPVYLCLMSILSIFKRNYEWKGRDSR